MSNAYVGDYDGPSPQGIDWNPGGVSGLARYGDDRRAIVFFHRQSVWNEQKSIHAGRRIYDEQDFVSIQHPGEREQKIDRPVKEEDKYRWPHQWQQYQRKETQVTEGTPIDLMLPNHPGIADNLKSAGVTTVEQLANISDTGMRTLGMGAQDYVNYARAYLEHAKKGVGFHEMKKELADRDAKIRTQEQRIDLLTQQLDQLLKQNAAVLSAMPGNYAAQATVGEPVPGQPFAYSKQPPFSMPPLPAKMPETESAKSVAAKVGWEKRRAKQAEQEPESANAAD